MNKYIKIIMLLAVVLFTLPASAQNRISGTVSDEFGGIPGIQVKELDANNRIVSSAITDANGNFTMIVKNLKNKLQFHGMGYNDKTFTPIKTSPYRVNMNESTKQMKEVVIKGKKSAPTSGLDIPQREYAGAVSTMKMDDLEGLAFESVDQALQGQIAGLDIVANSGNLGSGTTMRLRGVTTINGNAQPLIVVNDHIFELPEDAQDINFEDMDNEEQFSTLLNVNTEDIESITVLKDAASAAKWGVQGSNGVIEIKLRRGKRGPTRVNFSYKFNGTWQPDGYKMLNGDGYTMMQKEAFFNPTQTATAIPELDYNTELPYIYNHYSHNTDWLDAVKQFGKEHRYYINLSGGGEKATFRIGAGYNKSTGSVVGQKMNQFTESTTLDYQVSDRIQFRATVNMTFTNNHKNGAGNNIIGRAYNAMPNMSIYEYDAMGNPTGNYFNMLPLATNWNTGSKTGITNDGTMTSWELRSMFTNGNPLAYANGAWWKMNQYNLTPQFDVTYKLWGKDSEQHQLNYKGDVQLNIFNTSNDNYIPSELKNMPWVWGGDKAESVMTSNQRNAVSNDEYKSLEFTTRHELHYYSHFKNEDHSLRGFFRFEMATGSSSKQYLGLWNVPDGITDPTVVALLDGASASNNEWRRHSFFEQIHYSYKSKYSIDLSLRTDGRTDFGRGHKYGTFPSVGARWNISDEKFMEKTRSIISMLAFRPTWGITGYPGQAGGNQYNKYGNAGYYNGHTVVRPVNLSLPDLKWEKTAQWNLGFNLGLLDDLLTFEFEVYNKRTTDLLMGNFPIPSVNGFSALSWVNNGIMTNKGWELNGSTAKFAKIGKFAMKLRGNVSQNFNKVEDMDELIRENLNGSPTWNPTNFAYQKRVQLHSALGSIYGLKYLGVYRYDYDHNGYTNSSWKSYGYAEVDASGAICTGADDAALRGTGYDAAGNPINTAAAAARRGENFTCPIAHDASGNMLTDAKGNPLPMYYCYNEGSRYQFQGGDAMYEDTNHDGSIDRYDIVYLGNSNPKLYGGFGINLYYGRFELNASFNFRMGSDILNLARSRYESMRDITNQSYATTWRWRKNGDITDIPRALTGVNGYASYNSLVSDRYVEKGDYLRLQYIQVKYNFDPAKLKKIGIQNLYLSATINNVFCWSKYTGVDPEVSIGGFNMAVDESKTPRPKSFTCSVNLGF